MLPSSSPQAPTILGEALLVEDIEADTSAIAEEDESPEYTGPSLLDVEGEEDALPRPKKVSSTQALRALSQQPLDAGTIWTVVNADTEDAPKMNGQQDIGAAASGSTTPTQTNLALTRPTESQPPAGALPGRGTNEAICREKASNRGRRRIGRGRVSLHGLEEDK